MKDKDLFYYAWKQPSIYQPKLNIPSNIQFGIEIEFGDVFLITLRQELDKQKVSNEWDVKRDGSITTEQILNYEWEEFGGEVSSPVYHDAEETWDEVKKVCTSLIRLGASASSKTGAHVHIDADILQRKKEFIIRLLKLWSGYEDGIYQSGYGPIGFLRPYNDCARRIRELIINNLNKIEACETYEDLIAFLKNILKYKKYGLNFSHIKTDDDDIEEDLYNTFELRFANGTLSPKFWQHLVKTDSHLLTYVTSDDFDEELIDYRLQNKMDNIVANTVGLANLIFDDEKDRLYFLKYCFDITTEKRARTLARNYNIIRY